MRPLETLLLLGELVAFLGLAVPALRGVRWMRRAAPVVLGLVAAHVLVEGQRWQMFPAYVLGALFFLIWVLQRRHLAAQATRLSPTKRLAARLAAVLGVLALAFSTMLPILVPIFRLPQPTGPYAIGTATYHWIDSARTEVYTADPTDRRELMVQIWYPAKDNSSLPRAHYVEDGRVLAPVARLFGLPPFVFGHLQYVITHGARQAPVAGGDPYPVLVFSHGRGGFRGHNTTQVEELVSHGYVVAAVDHPYASTGVVFPDGHIKSFDARMFDPSHPGHPAFLDTIIPFLARDDIFTLDRLAALNQSDPKGLLTGRLDLARAGTFGMSLGGAVSAEACRTEPRFRACLFMDVFMPADVVDRGLQRPTMWISRDARSMELEHWAQRDIDETQSSMRHVFASLPEAGYLVLVPGTFHANFADLPLWSPLTRPLGLTGPIDAHRAHAVINAFSVAFFDRHLKGLPAVLLDRPAERYPEVLFETRQP